jgi:hypothetical protein
LEENYRPNVRPRPRLSRRRVFTVRRRGKNRVRADMGIRADPSPSLPLFLPPLPSPLSPSLPSAIRADAGLRSRGRENKFKKIKINFFW